MERVPLETMFFEYVDLRDSGETKTAYGEFLSQHVAARLAALADRRRKDFALWKIEHNVKRDDSDVVIARRALENLDVSFFAWLCGEISERQEEGRARLRAWITTTDPKHKRQAGRNFFRYLANHAH